ncbi:MAG TPA: AMP-binding protein [Pseudoclavibacter sp.]|nr:AMP-binding protein [Pseudoclavibacter sp.]
MQRAHDFNARRGWTQSYTEGTRADIELPTGSLVDVLDDSCQRYAELACLDFFGQEISFREFHRLVQRAAGWLYEHGVRFGDRVALLMPNCPQHMIAFYAVWRLGGVVVEHNPLYTEDELRTQFLDHRAATAIVWDVKASVVQSIAQECGVETIISVNMVEAMPLSMRLGLSLPIAKAREARAKLTAEAPGTINFRALVKHAPVAEDVRRPTKDDIATLQYTSGTTGVPRGAIITHANLQSNARMGKAWMPKLDFGHEVIYAILPLFHSFGVMLTAVYAIFMGARAVMMPTFDAGMVAKASLKHPPTFLAAVPPMFDRMARVQRQNPDGCDLHHVVYAVSGAMTLNDAVVDRWESATGGLLAEGYGLTEASPVVLANPFAHNRKVGTIGIPFPSTQMKIVDPDDLDREVEFGEVGELLVKGPQVFQGYWNRPNETAQTLLPDGWLRTGDLVTEDEDGFVTVVDRKKEIIITGGFNVSPSEVEKVLLDAPGVAEAAVVGISRGTNKAEIVTAVVVPEQGTVFDEAAVRAYCREHLVEYKVPRAYVVWDELPKNLMGKVQRKQVKDRLLAENA